MKCYKPTSDFRLSPFDTDYFESMFALHESQKTAANGHASEHHFAGRMIDLDRQLALRGEPKGGIGGGLTHICFG